MGCAVALRAAQRGLKVTVLERSVPGAEASSAAAGILAPQEESAAPGPLLDLGLASRERWEPFAAELRAATGMEVGYRRCGLIAVAEAGPDGDGAEALRARAQWQAARGLRAELLDGDALAALEPAVARAPLALHLPDEAQVEPPLVMRALQLA